jgi:hypothetical protein
LEPWLDHPTCQLELGLWVPFLKSAKDLLGQFLTWYKNTQKCREITELANAGI